MSFGYKTVIEQKSFKILSLDFRSRVCRYSLVSNKRTSTPIYFGDFFKFLLDKKSYVLPDMFLKCLFNPVRLFDTKEYVLSMRSKEDYGLHTLRLRSLRPLASV